MSEIAGQDASLKQLLDKMVAAKQLSSTDAAALLRQSQSGAQTPLQEEADVLRWLAQEYDLAYTTLEDVEPDRQLLSLFPARILLKEELLPLRRVNGSVEVATSRLFATQGLDALKTHDRLDPQAGAGLERGHPARDEEAAGRGRGHDRHAGRGCARSRWWTSTARRTPTWTARPRTPRSSASSTRCCATRSSCGPRTSTSSRSRTSSASATALTACLQDVPVPAQIKRFQPAIVSRVKILSHLNIAEKRLPQDGRIKIRIEDAEVDIRVSVIPMLHGEAVVLRLLRQNATLRGMGELGMDTRELECFRRVLATAARHHPGHRPDRQRQDHDALHRAQRDQRRRPQDHHHRGPGRVPARGRQPDPGLGEGRADLRARAALDPAPRPGRDSDRRNPRPGDGADRGAGLADRPPGLLDAAHQRRARAP